MGDEISDPKNMLQVFVVIFRENNDEFSGKKVGGAKAVWSFSENTSKSDNPGIP